MGIAAGALAAPPAARAAGSNERLGIGFIGPGGRGMQGHVEPLAKLRASGAPIELVAVNDVYVNNAQKAVDYIEKETGAKPKQYDDYRELLADKNIDAVCIGTPDHWHTKMVIDACRAGKDVYVEKPISQNLWEGRKMVEAARKYDRIVQYGNHTHGHHTGEMQLEAEKLGRIQVVWSSLNRMRKSIGKVTGPQPVPQSVNYDLWTGPAPLEPLMRKRLHYDWHWVWSAGTGELGNNGIYPLNQVRLALGQNTLPRRVLSLGGRFTFNDDGQTPNSQLALFQYDPGPLVIFELRNLPSEKGPKTIGSNMKCERGESRLQQPLFAPH
ncbi:MAG: Gfo/Idh/MocA family oxidoreductase [Nitrospirae bacterium]|nr:Gfo/Idh/MocA family oxidoreductase [Nitrospirota bacterium]